MKRFYGRSYHFAPLDTPCPRNGIWKKIGGNFFLVVFTPSLCALATPLFINFLYPLLKDISHHPKHRLRTPKKPFFHRDSKLLGLGRQFGKINFEAFGVFLSDLSATILVLWVPCPWFPLINHYFYKKLSLYIQIPNIYLGLGFEFGSQRIKDLVFECP